MNKVKWTLALVFQSIILTVSIIIDLGWIFSRIKIRILEGVGFPFGLQLITLFFVLLSYVLSILLATMIHYECWKVLPSGYRNQITPSKAVGFLFIPFYNFYWFFISYPCLASGYYRYGKNNNVNEIHDQRGLAIAYAVLSICNTFFILVPLIRSVTYIAAFVIFVLFYQRMVSYANLVSNMQSKI